MNFAEILVEYISIWAPALVAIFGTVFTGFTAIKEILKAIREFKDDTTIKEIKEKLDTVLKENRELAKANRKLLDKVTNVNNYLPEE